MSEQYNTVLARIYGPHTIKLALLCVLTVKKNRHTNSLSSLASFINTITFESRKLVITEDGIRITKSLFIPFNIMTADILEDISYILEIKPNRNIFVDADNKNNVVYRDKISDINVLGIGNIVCGLFLLIKGLSRNKNQIYLMAFFDTVVSKIVFEQRVEFCNIVGMCVDYGYVSKKNTVALCT